MNTKISYMYTDHSNNKRHCTAIVSGRLNGRQRKTILNSLFAKVYFIPELVYLPGDSGAGDRNQFHALYTNDLEVTEEAPTVNRSIQEVAEAFKKHANAWSA